jgi:hypothetical protein
MQPIYIDVDEEVTSILDKIRAISGPEVAVVIPRNATILQSIVNLRILFAEIASLGKQAIVVTKDHTGKQLAARAGFTVRQSIDSQDYVPFPIQDPTHAQERPDVVVDDGHGEDVSAEVPEWVVEREQNRAHKENGVSSSQVTPLPAVAETSSRKKRKRRGKRRRRITLLPSVSYQFLLSIIVPTVVVCLLVAFLILPSARIDLRAKTEPITRTVVLELRTSQELVDPSSILLPAQVVREQREYKQMFPATGKKLVGEKATGNVTVLNRFSSDPQPLGQGTRLRAADGKVFELVSAVTVPGAKVSGGEAIAGQVQASVVALDVGPEFNIEKTTFTILGLSAEKQADIFAQSVASFSGGSSQEVNVVAPEDIEKARVAMEAHLEEELRAQLQQKQSDDIELLEHAVEFHTSQVSTSIPVGEQAGDFEVRMTMDVQALVFTRSDAEQLAQSQIHIDIPEGKHIIESRPATFTYSIDDVEFSEGSAELTVFIEHLLAFSIDAQAIEGQLLGMHEVDARTFLDGIDHIESYELRLWPFWVEGVPKFAQKVHITLDNF